MDDTFTLYPPGVNDPPLSSFQITLMPTSRTRLPKKSMTDVLHRTLHEGNTSSITGLVGESTNFIQLSCF
jgi:hypothetical protein